ncbi:MAG: type III-A CRISPR-associated protein Cas10/Csm1 [Nitrospirae bacterium]|nr:MAG: type III-A CRISPR-associated protein Cas10/Csm1 [Nitrospirota bacterium]
MEEDVLKIAIAAFMHDIGKFADKSVQNIPEYYIKNNATTYLPLHRGNYSHYHAVYTAFFIESNTKILPIQLNTPGWCGEESFINISAGHHLPETPLQWVIAVADRVSSGWDRKEFDEKYNKEIPIRDYKKTRLLTIFEQIDLERKKNNLNLEDFKYYYPLSPLSPTSIFPKKRDEISQNIAEDDYKRLYDDFIKALKRLKHKEESLELWFEHFENLLMHYTSCIPSARVGNIIPDVSLYDHCRATAALASAIYIYHRDNNDLKTETIKDYKDKKFLLISSDFYGIQQFIFSTFSDSRRYRSKILRGRSFTVSLLSELIADMLCRSLSLPSTSILFNAAGKFTIIAPNTEKAKLEIIKVDERINEWLYKVSYGESSIGLTTLDASCDDFVSGNFPKLWKRISKKQDEKKFKRLSPNYLGVVGDYLRSFDNNLHSPLCPICGKRPSEKRAEGTKYVKDAISSCSLCRDHICLGTNLVKEYYLSVIDKDADINLSKEEKLFEPLFGRYQIVFGKRESEINRLARRGELFRYWRLGSIDTDREHYAAVKYINGYIPVYDDVDTKDERLLSCLEEGENIEKGIPKTLTHIARMALNKERENTYLGIDALGVLKADVDYMGLLMSCGLGEKQLTLSRLSNLSRQFDYYFTIYLPHLLSTNSEYKDIYTVFSGGDDLFLIGPWNKIFKLSLEINRSFKEYVCYNENIHLSMGITVAKSHTPVEFLSRKAEEALKHSKNRGRNRITAFSETVTWDQFYELFSIKDEINQWLDEDKINKAMLYRVNQLIDMAIKEYEIKGKKEINISEIHSALWRSHLSYTIARNVSKDKKGEDREEDVKEVATKMTQWIDVYRGALRIPLWYILYNKRKKTIGGKNE